MSDNWWILLTSTETVYRHCLYCNHEPGATVALLNASKLSNFMKLGFCTKFFERLKDQRQSTEYTFLSYSLQKKLKT